VQPRYSPLALFSAALGVLGIPLFPSLLGLAALLEIRDSGGARRGTGLARFGIAMGIVWLVLEGAALGLYLAHPDALFRRLYSERIALGESSAPRGLALVAAQQEAMKREDMDKNGIRDYWTGDISGLYRLQMERHGRPEAMGFDIARADAANTAGEAPTPREGYLYRTVVGVDSLTQYAATAYPRTRGEDGFLTFYVDERGVVWKKDIQGAPADHRMEDPAAEGWERVPVR